MKKIVLAFLAILGSIMAYALEDGVYEIQSAINRNYVIDNNGSNLSNGNNVHLWERNGTDAQKWRLVNYKDGTVTLRTMCGYENNTFLDLLVGTYTIYMLDLNGSNIYNGNNIHLWEGNGTNAQRWILTRNSNGSYTIRSSINRNYVIDDNGSIISNGNNIHLWEANGTAAQQWYFVKVK